VYDFTETNVRFTTCRRRFTIFDAGSKRKHVKIETIARID